MRVDEYNNFTSLLSRYRAALFRLSELGVRVSPTSRLRSYERRLEQSLNDPRPAVEWDFVMKLAFDLREIDEIVEIVDNLPPVPDAATLRLLRRLHQGAEHPDDDKSGVAREAQYELYLGAVFRRAGIGARHGDPDLVATWRAHDYYCEAKRPSSSDRVDDRLRSAVQQVRHLPERGIVALSLDQVVRPAGQVLSAPLLGVVAPEVNRLITAFVAANSSIWKRRLSGEPVDAVLFTARVPARLSSTGHLVLGSNLHVEVLAPQHMTSSAGFLEAAVRAYMAAQPGGSF